MERLFVDTSVWFAHANGRDPDHPAVREVLESFAGRLVTSSYVFDEIVTLCRQRLGHGPASAVGRALLDVGEVDLIRITAADERAAWELFLDRPDKVYSFTDCTSFVLLRRLGIDRAAALDDDFRREGFAVLP